MKKFKALGAAVLALTANLAFANPSRHAVTKHPVTYGFFDSYEASGGVEPEVAGLTDGARKPASASSVGKTDVKADYRAFTDRFLAVKSADDLDALLKEYNQGYDGYSPDLKFLVAQTSILMPLRSVIWRLRPVFESNPALHSLSVSALRTVAGILKVDFPTEQWAAGWDYITVPSADSSSKTQFQTISDFQKYLYTEVAPVFALSAKRLAGIQKSVASAKLVGDHQIAFGRGTFDDDLNRFRTYGPAEVAATRAKLHAAMASVSEFCAYDRDQALDAASDIGRLYGVDGFFPMHEFGVSARERTKVIVDHDHYKSYLTLKTDLIAVPKDLFTNKKEQAQTPAKMEIGKVLMWEAYKHLHASVKLYQSAWKTLSTESADELATFNPLLFQARSRINSHRIAAMVDMLEGPTDVKSEVTGELVKLDIPAFYRNPPADLKDLMPVDFDNGPDLMKMKNRKGETLEYRNYYRGRATKWDLKAWSTLIPSAKNESDPAYIATALRILDQSWGGQLAALPISTKVR